MIINSELYFEAGKPNTSRETLEQLAWCASENVRRRVAERRLADADLLDLLSNDSSPEVRSAVAANLNTPRRVLLNLVTDPSVDVRFSMAENHALSKSILELLEEDENAYVQWRAHVTLHHLRGS